MMILAVTIAIGVLAFIGVFGLAYAIFIRDRSLEERVWEPHPTEEQGRLTLRDLWKRLERVFKPVGGFLPRSADEMSRQQKRLVKAGIRHKDGPVLFYGVKLTLAVVLMIVSSLLGYLPNNPFLYIVLSIFFGALIPDIWLTRKGKNRIENIQLGLPDVLDLAVVCVEAGLGLDQALMRIGQEVKPVHPALSDELRLYNLEVNAGRSRADALRNLAARSDIDDLKSLVAVLIQTDRFGTSIAQSLRVYSDSLRTKRRQRAEERAAKTTIKIIPVLVFFILPAVFIVVLLPAFISIVNELLPKLSGG
jgi:tight adherence protein C